MPTYKYEAMDTSGGEVKDSVEAANEEEAQQKIKQLGYFVTKITESGRRKKGKGKAKGKAQEGPDLHHSAACPARHFAHSPASFRRCKTPACRCCGRCSILEHQMKPGVLKNALIDVVDDVESGSTLERGVCQASQVLRSALRQHGQGRRGRRCPRSHPAAPRRLQGKIAEPETEDHGRHDLPRGGHHGGRGHLDVHHVVHHSEVREDLQRLQHGAARHDADADGDVALVRQLLVRAAAVPALRLAAAQADPDEQERHLTRSIACISGYPSSGR